MFLQYVPDPNLILRFSSRSDVPTARCDVENIVKVRFAPILPKEAAEFEDFLKNGKCGSVSSSRKFNLWRRGI